MRYRLLSLADTELAEAAKWYKSQAPGLGLGSLDEFEAAMHRIMPFPEAWTGVGPRHRRCLFRKFPYAVLYSGSEPGIGTASALAGRFLAAVTGCDAGR